MGFLIISYFVASSFATVQLRHSTGTAFKAEEHVAFYSESVDTTLNTFFAAPRQVMHDLGYANAILCHNPEPYSLSEPQFAKLDQRLIKFFDDNLVTTKNLRVENASDMNRYEKSVERIKVYQKQICASEKEPVENRINQAFLEKQLSDDQNFHSLKENKDWSFSNLITDLFVGIGGLPGFFGAASLQHEQNFQRKQV